MWRITFTTHRLGSLQISIGRAAASKEETTASDRFATLLASVLERHHQKKDSRLIMGFFPDGPRATKYTLLKQAKVATVNGLIFPFSSDFRGI